MQKLIILFALAALAVTLCAVGAQAAGAQSSHADTGPSFAIVDNDLFAR